MTSTHTDSTPPAAPQRPVVARRVSRSRPIPTGLPDILLRIRACESDGNYQATNASSTASGGWQVLDSTWAGYGGYQRALSAPRAVQDAFALGLYRREGTSPWAASRRCWA